MDKVVLQAVHRNVVGKQVKSLRRQGKLPGVIYGHHLEPLPILLDAHDTEKLLTGLAPSTIITLDVAGKSFPTLVREKQRNKILGSLIHVDFLAVSMKEKLRADVSLSIVGVSPAVKDLNGILVQGINTLEVECLPQDLPENIDVDISSLNQIGDAIYISHLKLSDRIKILNDEDTLIVSITAQQEVEEVAEEIAPVEPEVVEKGKKEEEED